MNLRIGAARLVLGLTLAATAGCSRPVAPQYPLAPEDEALLLCDRARTGLPTGLELTGRGALIGRYPVTRTAYHPPAGGEPRPVTRARRLPEGTTLMGLPATMVVMDEGFNGGEGELVFRASGQAVVRALKRRGVAIAANRSGLDPPLLTTTADLDAQQAEEASNGDVQVWGAPADGGYPTLKVYGFGRHLAVLWRSC